LKVNSISISQDWLTGQLVEIEAHLSADVLSMVGPIGFGTDDRVRRGLEAIQSRRPTLIVILDTLGGTIEIVERIVHVMRHFYGEVRFLVPDRALSAGTVLVMSGDAILMDYYSCLGPVDPQIFKNDRLVPGLSYLEQYHRLIRKAQEGTLTSVELVMLQSLDLAELHQIELTRDLSVQLVKNWLAQYKFKDWKTSSSTGAPVTEEKKHQRAEEIGEALNKHDRWGSHGRGINMETLRNELRLQIDDFGEDRTLRALVWDYFTFLREYMEQHNLSSHVHTNAFV
jgi:hypothetical protein